MNKHRLMVALAAYANQHPKGLPAAPDRPRRGQIHDAKNQRILAEESLIYPEDGSFKLSAKGLGWCKLLGIPVVEKIDG